MRRMRFAVFYNGKHLLDCSRDVERGAIPETDADVVVFTRGEEFYQSYCSEPSGPVGTLTIVAVDKEAGVITASLETES